MRTPKHDLLIYESDIENYLYKRVAAMGGLCIKIGYDGLPDRLLLLPGGEFRFVELKRPGGSLSPLQSYRLRELSRMGFSVAVPSTKEDCDEILRGLL